MTILCDPTDSMLYTDRPVFPLRFATAGAVEVADSKYDSQARIAGVRTLHYEQDGICAEDALNWPCPTHRVVTA